MQLTHVSFYTSTWFVKLSLEKQAQLGKAGYSCSQLCFDLIGNVAPSQPGQKKTPPTDQVVPSRSETCRDRFTHPISTLVIAGITPLYPLLAYNISAEDPT